MTVFTHSNDTEKHSLILCLWRHSGILERERRTAIWIFQQKEKLKFPMTAKPILSKQFYRQGLISSEQLEKLMAMQDNKSVPSAA